MMAFVMTCAFMMFGLRLIAESILSEGWNKIGMLAMAAFFLMIACSIYACHFKW